MYKSQKWAPWGCLLWAEACVAEPVWTRNRTKSVPGLHEPCLLWLWSVSSLSSWEKCVEDKSEKKESWEALTIHLYPAYKRSIWEVSAFHLNQMFLFFIFKQWLTLFQIFLEEHSVLSPLMTNSYWWVIISGKTHMGYKGFQCCLWTSWMSKSVISQHTESETGKSIIQGGKKMKCMK